jgi:hypothetical protein
LHKPLDTAADEKRTFDAVAGVSQEDWDAYQKANSDLGSEVSHAVRDCLNLIGLQVFSDLGDIVKDAEHWKVDWSISNNKDNSRHEKAITWDPGEQESGVPHLGNWRSDMVKTSDHSYEAAFIVDIGTETAADHLGSPSVKIDDVYVCGAVFSAEVPELQTFVNAGKGPLGLTDAIVDLGAGWLRTVAGPESCRTLTVLWHEPCAAFGPQSLATAAGDASALAANGATTDPQLPCAYEGTASSTSVWDGLTWIATASDLRFELKPPPPDSPPGGPLNARYDLVRGNVTVQASGTRDGCTLSGGFSIPAPIDDGVHELAGYILVDVQKSEYSAAGSAADQEGHLNHCAPRQLDGQYGLLWLSMTVPDFGDPGRSFTPGGALEGSNDFTDPFYLVSVHSQWSLHPAECNPSPEPVCQ